MILNIPQPVQLNKELLLSPAAYIKLFEENRQVIASTKYIPPRLGSNEITGYVKVKFRSLSAAGKYLLTKNKML